MVFECVPVIPLGLVREWASWAESFRPSSSPLIHYFAFIIFFLQFCNFFYKQAGPPGPSWVLLDWTSLAPVALGSSRTVLSPPASDVVGSRGSGGAGTRCCSPCSIFTSK